MPVVHALEIENLRRMLAAYQRDGRTGTAQSENVIDAAIAVVAAYDAQRAEYLEQVRKAKLFPGPADAKDHQP